WPVGAVSKITSSYRPLSSATTREMRSKSAASSMPGIDAARSICFSALSAAPAPKSAAARSLTLATYSRASLGASISMAKNDGRISRSSLPTSMPSTSEVECAGSVETRRTFLPARLPASAPAAAHVVLPTPPLPPKNRICRSRRCRTSAAGECADRGVLDAHAPVPEMKLLEQQRVHVEQVERCRVRHTHQLQIAKKHEEVVEFQGLPAEFVGCPAVGDAVPEIAGVLSEGLPVQGSWVVGRES